MTPCCISTGSKHHLFLQLAVADFVLLHVTPASTISSLISVTSHWLKFEGVQLYLIVHLGIQACFSEQELCL